MYAIVDIAGQQFKVEQGQEVFVHRLEGEEGAKLEFEKVLLLDKGGDITVGTPVVEGVKITAKLVEHLRGDKVIVFHKKVKRWFIVRMWNIGME